MTALTLLGDVRWRGAPVASERSRALLAALAAAGGRPVRAERLIDLVWGEEAPADAAKGLQVLVSRTRTALGADAIVRDAVGYRLGVDPAEVDSVRLSALARDAAAALDDDADRAATLAREALALANGLPAPVDAEADPLAELRRAAAGDLATARVVLARASSRTGAHAQALPALEAAHAERPDDEALLADLLRSEAAVRGPGAALERYEAYRQDLLDRLGTNPGERLRRVHRDLLALDRPVRSGVRYDASSLRGRDRDVARLRSLLTDARVVSIIGPGGLGKTRLAHVLARDAAEPVVHVVELVGVTTAEDVVGEVGSVLGVRDSVSAQRTLTPEQRARRPQPHRAAAGAGAGPARARQLRARHRCRGRAGGLPRLGDRRPARAHDEPRAARDRRGARLPARRARAGRRGRAVLRPRARRAPRRRAARGDRAQHRDPARRPAAGDRAGRREGPRDVGRGDRPAPRGPLRAAARRRPRRARPPPDPARRDRLVVEPARRGRAARAAPARAVQRRVHARGGGRGARRRRAGRGPGARRPVAAERPRRGGRPPLPDARDRPRVRPPAARRRPARAARHARPGGRGRSRTPAAAAMACSAATSSRRSTRSPPRRSTSPTSCATRSPTATAARSSSCSPCSGPSGRSAASTPA